ncbi:MAG: hypothetical protein KF760_00490 [Candidatus Eremiobacteraeota bacterium]|nr:hypothetical protein [Candidatus Eremiobacteraeota bacterium]MCW5870960.1 hypothetical protein [Candidatus Eremiobacteraeota bacterium]
MIPNWLIGLVLLWGCLAACYQHIPSPDLWWLLADGRWISQTGSIPVTDPFSWSAQGRPWHNDQWLAGWFAFQVYRLAGLEGLHLLKALVLTATLGLLLDTGRRLRGDDQVGWLAPALALTIFSAEGRFFFDVRAYLATYFCLALLWRWLQLRERLHPAAIFGLFLFWANLHGGVSSGLLLLGLTAVTRRSRQLLAMTGLGLLAACCNPSGIWLLLHPLRLLGSPWGLYLNEWTPAWRRPDLFVNHFAGLGLWLIWGLAARPRWQKNDALLLFFALFSLTGWRHIPLFALLALPRWCYHLRGPAWVWSLTLPGLLLWAGFKPLRLADPGQSLERQYFPREACNLLAEHPELPRKLFHPYGLGGYLLWRGYQVAIDGRAVQVYPWETYRQYLSVALPTQQEGNASGPARARFDEFCRRHGVEAALLFTHQKEAGLWLVQGNKRWRPVYADDLVTVVVTEKVQWSRQ